LTEKGKLLKGNEVGIGSALLNAAITPEPPYFDCGEIRASSEGVRNSSIDKRAVQEDQASGTIDERAVAMKVLHPEWTDKQIAKAIGCGREALFKKNMVKYKAAKAALALGRQRYGKVNDRHRR
jgi:hypothetical protein